MNPDEIAFVGAITKDEEDDTPRLVYADWLQENDAEDHAGIFRAQCADPLAMRTETRSALDKLFMASTVERPAVQARARSVVERSALLQIEATAQRLSTMGLVEREFAEPVRELAEQVPGLLTTMDVHQLDIQRGVALLPLDAAWALANPWIFALFRHVRLTNLTLEQLRLLMDRQELANVQTLSLRGNKLGPEAAAILSGSKHCKPLTLDLSQTGATLPALHDLALLAAAEPRPGLEKLTRLDLSDNHLWETSVPENPTFHGSIPVLGEELPAMAPKLKALSLALNGLYQMNFDQGNVAHPLFKGLEVLDLSCNEIEEADLEWLLARPTLDPQTIVHWGGNPGAGALEQKLANAAEKESNPLNEEWILLAHTPSTVRTSVGVSGNLNAVSYFMKSKHWPEIQELKLGETHQSETVTLFRTNLPPKLRRLETDKFPVDAFMLEELIRTGSAQSFEVLEVADSPSFGDAALDVLCRPGAFPILRNLWLQKTKVTNLEPLKQSAFWTTLKLLALNTNRLGSESAATIAKCTSLEELYFYDVNFTNEDVKMILQAGLPVTNLGLGELADWDNFGLLNRMKLPNLDHLEVSIDTRDAERMAKVIANIIEQAIYPHLSEMRVTTSGKKTRKTDWTSDLPDPLKTRLREASKGGDHPVKVFWNSVEL